MITERDRAITNATVKRCISVLQQFVLTQHENGLHEYAIVTLTNAKILDSLLLDWEVPDGV